MISKEEYKKLEIGDEVSIRGTKCTVFYFEKNDNIPVGVLEGDPKFGIFVSKDEKSPSFQERLKAQIAAGFSPNARSYRIHEHEVEKIISKAKDKVQIKKLKKEDLKQLKVGDIVSINGLERKVETLELDGFKEPWVKSFTEGTGQYPCAGDCHPQNKKLKLDFNEKYASLDRLLSDNAEIMLKTPAPQIGVVENKMSKKDIYFKTIKAMKGSGYDYGTSIFAELNDCYDEIEMFCPDPDNFFLSKNLSKIKLIESFSRSIPSEFTHVDTKDPIQKDIYNIFESTSGEFVKLNCLSEVDIFDEEECVDSTISDPQKNVSADVFALYRCPATNELKAVFDYDLNKILDNIKNKIYYPTGKKKISEKEAELLKKFGFTEKANVIDDSKENIMSEKVGLVNLVKSDAQEAAYRTAAKKGVRALRAAMLRVAKDKGADRKEVNYLRKAFESDLGEAVLSMALGYMLTYAPLPETVKNNKHFGRIVGELRIGGIQIGMDTILSEAMGYIGPVLDEIKNLLPENSEEITTVLPARIAKPTTKRIKTSPKEDLDESEEDEVAEKSAKKA